MIFQTECHRIASNPLSGQEGICIGTVQREAISQVLYNQDVRNTLLTLGVMEKDPHADTTVLRLKRCALHDRWARR